MSSAGSALHKEHLIVPFDSTTDALALQACAQRYGLVGRLRNGVERTCRAPFFTGSDPCRRKP